MSDKLAPPDDPSAVIRSSGKGLDLDDPEALAELARSLRVDPGLIEGYGKAQVATDPLPQPHPQPQKGPLSREGCGSSGSSAPEEEERGDDTAELLGAVIEHVLSYAILPSDAQATALALFTLNTYVYDLWDYTPYLLITSATKRSGKTRLLDVLTHVVARPWKVLTPSEAALFRIIDEEHPTVLLDETDALTESTRDAIRALLNAGFESGNAVPRVVGEAKNMQVKRFDVYCPKVIAGIGKYLSDTTLDRTIPIAIKRKNKDDKLPRFRKRRVKQQTQPLQERFVQWGVMTSPRLAEAEPELPEELHDRAADIWEPLLAIADMAGGDWPKRAREAAIELHSGREEEAVNVLLLRHLRELFNDDGGIAMHAETILNGLIKRDDGPWPKWWEHDMKWGTGQSSKRNLAHLLEDFDIAPKDVKVNLVTKKGYRREWFEDAWRRYLDDDEAPPDTEPFTPFSNPLPPLPPLPEPVSRADAVEKGSGSGSGSGSVQVLSYGACPRYGFLGRVEPAPDEYGRTGCPACPYVLAYNEQQWKTWATMDQPCPAELKG